MIRAPMPLTLLPSIDLRSGQVVRLYQGDYAQQTTYPHDPAAVLASFAAAGAAHAHIVDLDGAKEGRPMQLDTIRALIAGSGLSIQVGGGVRSTADVEALLSAGAARVVVGTAAFENWDWFTQLAKRPDMVKKITLAIDAKAGVIATRGWTASSGKRAIDVAQQVNGWPLAGLLYTDVAVDGTLAGPNVQATAELAAATDVPVIASGGIGSLAHVLSLKNKGIWGAILGKSLYEGKVDLAAAIRVAKTDSPESAL